MKTDRKLKLVERKSKSARGVDQPIVIAGERYRLLLLSQKIHRRQMNRIQGSHRLGKGLQGSGQYGLSQFYQGQTAQQRANFVCVRIRQFPRVNPRPDFILDEPAGNQRLLPEAVWWHAVFRQEVSEGD